MIDSMTASSQWHVERPAGEAVEGVPVPAGTEGTPTGGGTPAVWRGCPYLVVPGGAWRSVQPIREHRCTAVRPPVTLTQEKQRRLCLEPLFTACPDYLEAVRARDALLASAGLTGSGPRRPFVRTAPVVLEGPSPRGWGGSRGGAFQRSSQIGLLIVIVVAAAALAFARLPGNSPAGESGAVASQPAATASQTPSPAASTPTPLPATPAPTSAPSAPPATPLASPHATSAPSPSVASGTYRGKRGDTLSGIATRYHTTVKVLQELNGIANASYIQVGQLLKVP